LKPLTYKLLQANHPPWILLKLLLIALLLSGCAGQVIVSQEFPEPIAVALPQRIGVYYNPEFLGYTYIDEDSRLKFELGSKQHNLFGKVFDAMFLQAIPVTSVDAAASGVNVDLVIEPKLEEYAFLSPIETATDFYAVSLRYQIRIYSPDGTIVGYWPLVAFGKSRSRLVKKNESLGDATTMALRDVAAAMVSQFRNIVEKEEWKTAALEE
jgi:hypothetical protein